MSPRQGVGRARRHHVSTQGRFFPARGIGLYLHWAPWYLAQPLPRPENMEYIQSSFSRDDSRVIRASETYRDRGDREWLAVYRASDGVELARKAVTGYS